MYQLIPALASTLFQLGAANKQKKEADKIKNSNFVPGAVREAEANARRGTMATMPGYNQAQENIDRQTANTIAAGSRVGGSSAAIQQTVADANEQAMAQTKDLNVANAAYKDNKAQDLNQILMGIGDYQAKSNDAANAAKSALKGAAMQNQFNAVSGLAEGVIASSGTDEDRAAKLLQLAKDGKQLSPSQQKWLERFQIKSNF